MLAHVNSNLRLPINSMALFNGEMDAHDIRRANLLDLIRQFGTIKALAEHTGTDAAVLSQIKNTHREMGNDIARRIEQALGHAHGWMDAMHGHAANEPSRTVADEKYAMIRRYAIKGGAGNGHENGHEEISGTHAYRRDWLERKKLTADACVVIEVTGESMQPTITDGDVVLVNTASRKLLNGRVFAFNTEDGVRIKRLFKQMDGRVRMVSDNQDKTLYPDDYLTPSMEVTIIGEVVHRSGGV